MAYPDISTVTNASTDPTNLLVYANTITGGIFMPLVLGAFFVILLLGSYFAQIRFTGRGRIDFSLASSSYATFGMAVLMSMKNGLLSPIYIWIVAALAVAATAYLFMSSQDQ